MTRFLLTMLALSAAVVACGGDDGDGKTSDDGTSSGGSAGSGTGGGAGADGSSTDNGSSDGGSGGGSGSLCEAGCVLTLEADCPNGPRDQDTCVSTCEALAAGSCAAEYAEFQECSEGESLSCDEDTGIPIVEACAAEQGDFIDCLNG